jgi:hypothetical protein
LQAAIEQVDGVEYVAEIDVPRDNDALYRSAVEAVVNDDNGDWRGYGLLLAGQIHLAPAVTLLEDHPGVTMGTFDTSDDIFDALDKHQIAFGIDQQPYLQGYLPIPLLTYFSYSKQHLQNEFIESGPSFVTLSPSEQEQICEVNLFEFCHTASDSDESGANKEKTAGDSANVGIIVGLVFGGIGLVLAIVVVVHYLSRRQEPTGVPHSVGVKAVASIGTDLEEEEQPQQTGGAEEKSNLSMV